MKKIDCVWEKKNIGSKVLEFTVEETDRFSCSQFNGFDNYDYQVVKVPAGKADYCFGLSSLGFSFIEGQLKISKTMQSFNLNDKVVKLYSRGASFSMVSSKGEFDEILSRITPQMFSTDRITLDPIYGSEIGCRRYKNWMTTEFENHTSQFMQVFYKGVLVAYIMFRMKDLIMDSLLGGTFHDVKIPGLGLLAIFAPFVYFNQIGKPFKRFETSISTNNMPVRKIYNMFDFKLDKEYYVFVRHIKS